MKSLALRRCAVALGSYAELARKLKITRGAVAQWNKIPIKHVVALERLTGIAREELRKDIFRP